MKRKFKTIAKLIKKIKNITNKVKVHRRISLFFTLSRFSQIFFK